MQTKSQNIPLPAWYKKSKDYQPIEVGGLVDILDKVGYKVGQYEILSYYRRQIKFRLVGNKPSKIFETDIESFLMGHLQFFKPSNVQEIMENLK